MKLIYSFVCLAIFTTTIFSQTQDRRQIAEYLQDISVTIRSEDQTSRSEGSGSLITRVVEGEEITFVWTCGHVIDNLRNVRTIVDKNGNPKKIVEFKDVQIVQELVEKGRRVGEVKMDAQVLKYSDADDGEDLALLMVRSRGYGKASASFYLDEEEPIIPIGTSLYHVGSLRGQMGANSMTYGIVSQVGRILGHGKVEYDQTTVTAFPGSSGGGVYTTDGKYVGMIVRGAGEGFNFMVPVRRMMRWAEEHDIMWALDPKLSMPPLEEILDMPIEHAGDDSDVEVKSKTSSRMTREIDRHFPHHIYRTELNK